MHSLAWTDLQYVLAVADAGSLAKAATSLGVNHTTVLRRVGAFERSLGVKLFARSPTGYVLTASGEEIAAAARAMADTVDGIERTVAGRDLRLTGNVRVTTTDTLAASLLLPILASFSQKHAGIQLEVSTQVQMVNLSKRDADVAVRPTKSPPPTLIGRRIATVAYALYASPRYLAKHPARRALDHHAWIVPDDNLAATSVAAWIAKTITAPPVIRCDTFMSLLYAAVAGFGVVALPCFVGDTHAGLRRVRGVIDEMAIDLWVLTHADLRGSARIRAVTEHLAVELVAKRDIIEGRRPRD
jgi:DNA-binding transcriptional LysR family regulator